jgi:hypothetical protein
MTVIESIRKYTPSISFSQDGEPYAFFDSDMKIEFYKNSIFVKLDQNNQLKITGKIGNLNITEKKIFKCYLDKDIMVINFVTKLKGFSLCNPQYKYIGILYENDDMKDINCPNYKMELYGVYPIGSYVKDYKKVGTFYSDV